MTKNSFKVGSATMHFVKGDITEMTTDAIVNAANSTLMGSGGVDGAIHRVGGPKILEECKKIRMEQYPDGLPTGKALITSGGNLKAKYVIHTVGPIWRGGNKEEPKLLQDAYMNSLRLARQNRIKSIAFPSISTGAYGYPIQEASHIAVKAVKTFLEIEDNLEKVAFVLFSDHDLKIYLDAAKSELIQL